MEENSTSNGFYRKSPAQHVPGFIYLLKSSGGFYKIGCSINVRNRYAELRGQHKPYTLDLVHFFPCFSMAEAENGLHYHYAEKRRQGEWFELTEFDERVIKRIKYMGTPAEVKQSLQVQPYIPILLLDGRSCKQGDKRKMQRLNTTFSQFRLACNKCGQTSELVTGRDLDQYNPQVAPLALQIRCLTCSNSETAGFTGITEENTEASTVVEAEGSEFLRCVACGRLSENKQTRRSKYCWTNNCKGILIPQHQWLQVRGLVL